MLHKILIYTNLNFTARYMKLKLNVLAIEQITPPDNATVIRSIDHALFKERMNALICG